jgi:large subunit ribosomal protein LP2
LPQAINSIQASVGAEPDSEKCGKLLAGLAGKDIVDVLAAGRGQLSVLGGGGGGAAAEKAPEPEPEEEEEDMGFDLFD